MPGMKITLSAAMRARDVSPPSPEDMAEAEGASQDAAKPTADAGTAAGNLPGKRRGPRPRGSRPAPSATPAPAPSPNAPALPPAEPARDDSAPAGTRRTRRRSRTRRGRRQ